jgi:hypothetical protein
MRFMLLMLTKGYEKAAPGCRLRPARKNSGLTNHVGVRSCRK